MILYQYLNNQEGQETKKNKVLENLECIDKDINIVNLNIIPFRSYCDYVRSLELLIRKVNYVSKHWNLEDL